MTKMHTAINASFTGIRPINLFKNWMGALSLPIAESKLITEFMIGNKTAIFSPSKIAYNILVMEIAMMYLL